MHAGAKLDFKLWKNYRMRPFENKVLRKTLGHKKRTGECRKLQNGEFHVLYSFPNIMEYELHMEEKINAYMFTFWKREETRPLGKHARYLNMILTGIYIAIVNSVG